MKKSKVIFHPVVVFVAAQLSWLSLVGIWIFWYVKNYVIFDFVEDKISPQIVSKNTNILALVLGLFFLVAILVGMYLIFIYLNRQINITKLYDNFIANVTHELKSPLASIQLYLETISMRNISSEKQTEFISVMLKDTDRLQNLINSILEIAALDQKKIAYDYQIYDADRIIQILIKESGEQFKLPEQAILFRGKAICQCVIDRNALKIVIDNLIDNATKYNKGKVEISIDISSSAKYIVMKFCDQGIGISPKNQKLVFNKFQRIYNSNIPNVKGTGLGLYWVKQIIKLHGGRVTVFSAGEDKGTIFKIELPIYQALKKHYINELLKLTKKVNAKKTNDRISDE